MKNIENTTKTTDMVPDHNQTIVRPRLLNVHNKVLKRLKQAVPANGNRRLIGSGLKKETLHQARQQKM